MLLRPEAGSSTRGTLRQRAAEWTDSWTEHDGRRLALHISVHVLVSHRSTRNKDRWRQVVGMPLNFKFQLIFLGIKKVVFCIPKVTPCCVLGQTLVMSD